MEFLSISFTTTVYQIATSSKNFKNFNITPEVSVHFIVTCQGVFIPVPAFADYFSSLVQHIVQQAAICSFSFKHSRHRFLLTLYGWYCPKIFHTKTDSSFEAVLLSSFDNCVSFLCFSWLKDFLWFDYLVLNFVSDMS